MTAETAFLAILALVVIVLILILVAAMRLIPPMLADEEES